ncbi:MAG: phage terminase small subunit P27 family [Bacillota bacterium]
MKALKGTARADREKDHPQPTPIKPAPPAHLDEVARAKWAELADEMEKQNLLTRLDGATFAAYCQAYAHWVQCERVVQEHGRTYTTPNGQIKARPEFTAARQWLALLQQYSKELGLSPTSRLRMDLPKDNEPDEMDALLKLWQT